MSDQLIIRALYKKILHKTEWLLCIKTKPYLNTVKLSVFKQSYDISRENRFTNRSSFENKPGNILVQS